MMRVRPADVCLILEGTYPYVRGGVSSWVHEIIKGLPEISFSLLAISAQRHTEAARKYDLPANICSFAEVHIHELIDDAGPWVWGPRRRAAWAAVRTFHEAPPEQRSCPAMALLRATGLIKAISVREAFNSRASWDFVRACYATRGKESSFIDYFWTWRAIHAPLFQTLIAETPPARIYHAISTGYAGLLGALAKLRTDRPLLLTEHGIYVRERTLDVARADWIYEEPLRVRRPEPDLNPLKRMWTRFFDALGRMTYDAADAVIALFEGNAAIQRELGAAAAKIRVIPNGVDVDRYAACRQVRGLRQGSLRVGFVGRVVPIKDVKTLLRAFAQVEQARSDVELWIVGPTDEDPEYYNECVEMTARLGLRRVTFTGPREMTKVYPELDLMVLSSISEAQPLSILEAACAGVPTVATDVGACRELLEGRTAEDRSLGPSGRVVPVGDAHALALALRAMLDDAALRARYSAAGCARVERWYRQTSMLEAYRSLYQSYLVRK